MRNRKFGLRPDCPRTEAAPARLATIERLLTIWLHGSRRCYTMAIHAQLLRITLLLDGFPKRDKRNELYYRAVSRVSLPAEQTDVWLRLCRIVGRTPGRTPARPQPSQR